MTLPKKIQALIADESFQPDSIGQSEASVLLFCDKVLKIQPHSPETDNEALLLSWLHGKLPVPQILAYEVMDGTAYLLMSRIPGEMACSGAYMADPREQARLLAEGLRALWQVDISDCPVNCRLPHKLAAARLRVEGGLVDMDNVQPDTFGEGGFHSPEDLLRWLETHQPEEERALCHGDFCLPNLFFRDGTVSGYIDLGRGGIGDKWNDIALCYRSLKDNYSGLYDGKPHPGYNDSLLFRFLGLEPNWEKIRYYILLDELF